MHAASTQFRQDMPNVQSLSDDLDRRDFSVYAPLVAIVIGMPLAIAAMLTVSLWFIAQNAEHDVASRQSAPTTFAARWPDESMPQVVLR